MTADAMPIKGFHHVELYVGNAKQAAHYYRTAFGFTPIAYAGPETGSRDRVSYVLAQGSIRLVLTAGLGPESAIVAHHATHGDGIRDVAFTVPDAEEAFRVAVERGAQPACEPHVLQEAGGRAVIAAIKAYGDTIHSFVDTSDWPGVFLPGFVELPGRGGQPAAAVGLETIDHVVANVELGAMDAWVAFYADVMGFTQLVHYDDETISTEYSALMSKVLWDGTGRIKLPVNEPALGRKKSQIQEYLDAYRSPGVQHIALSTSDIVTAVAALRRNGLRLMRVPETYYADVADRLDWSAISADLDALAAQQILVDTDDEGYLLQIFTEPVQDRPTVFFELIERHGSRGFGEGNFKALFQAIEREQALRGNL
ncbi:MAG: 4-hydroxyphenylpyruvate dioxygenase [Egibacteraceae bacterium]